MTRWEKLQKLLSENDEKTRKHKEELFGSSLLEDIPDDFNLLSIIKKSYSWPSDFKKKPIHERAEWLAHSYLENMIEVIQRHDSIIKKNIDKRSSDSGSGNTGGHRRRPPRRGASRRSRRGRGSR